jgi:hypothetical protein
MDLLFSQQSAAAVAAPGGTNMLDPFFFLNSNKFVMAIMMVLMNVAGRYIDLDLHPDHRKFLANSTFMKRLFVFAIAFMATRDFIAALIITAIFVIFVMHLFNPKSPYNYHTLFSFNQQQQHHQQQPADPSYSSPGMT